MEIKNSIKIFTAAVTAAASLFSFNAGAYAKSLSIVGSQIEYRKQTIWPSAFKVYVKSAPENWVYYGAKFEPRAGIYFGTPYNKMMPGISNGINTQYDWFNPTDDIRNENCPRVVIPEKPSSHTRLRGYNWNFALKNSRVINIRDYTNYIYNKIDEIAAIGDDILLIFGKEFNIDDNFNDPELFKDCFRFVADYAHTKENIAMVWAPNDTGGLDTTFEEFYPGDEYVDWIGCSLYSLPYFQGNPNTDDGANMSFIMGQYANPSMRAKLIHRFMVENNIKKPVCITEGGVGFESPDGTDYRAWAAHQYRMYFADICRAYPEFKVFVNFNEYVTPGDLYRYDVSNDPGLTSLIQELTAEDIYLKSYPASAPYAYTELADNTVFKGNIELSAYAYIVKKPNLVVRYLIDGQWLTERSEPPYQLNVGSEYVSYGKHVLTCEIYDGTSISHSVSRNIELVPSDDNYIYSDEADNMTCSFADMADKPAEMKNAVGSLAGQGILTGVSDTAFAPDNRVSRAELAAMTTRLLGLEDSDTPSGLSDVGADDWYFGAVNAAVSEGIINGYEDGTFKGGQAVTKNEFIKILAQIYIKQTGETYRYAEVPYSDAKSSWYHQYICEAYRNGFVLDRHDGLFFGTGTVSRGDAAIMLNRLYNRLFAGVNDYIYE